EELLETSLAHPPSGEMRDAPSSLEEAEEAARDNGVIREFPAVRAAADDVADGASGEFDGVPDAEPAEPGNGLDDRSGSDEAALAASEAERRRRSADAAAPAASADADAPTAGSPRGEISDVDINLAGPAGQGPDAWRAESGRGPSRPSDVHVPVLPRGRARR